MRVLLAVAAFAGVALVLGVVATVFEQLGRQVFSASNRGLHGEWGSFSVGVCLLALAGWASGRTRRPDGTGPVTTRAATARTPQRG